MSNKKSDTYNFHNKDNIFAIDHGNARNDTVFSSFPCGLARSKSKPIFGEDWIKYEDHYYSLSEEPQPYLKDKTENVNTIVYTLFGLVLDEQKAKINLKKPIIMAVGLPPLHMEALKEPFKQYLSNALRDVTFTYNGVTKRVRVDSVNVYPQAFSAVVASKPRIYNGEKKIISQIFATHKRYVIVDIGGMTVDIIYFDGDKPIVEKSITVDLGTITMAESIQREVFRRIGYQIERRDIESLLTKEENIFPAELVGVIEEATQDWAEKIVNAVKGVVPDIRLIPIVFAGGGSLLLSEKIESLDHLPPMREFLKKTNANAEGYYLLESNRLKKG